MYEDWPYLEWGHWASPDLMERTKVDDEARKFPGLIEAMVCLLNEGEAGDAPIRLLGLIGTPEAFDVLRRIAFGTFGSDELRTRGPGWREPLPSPSPRRGLDPACGRLD